MAVASNFCDLTKSREVHSRALVQPRYAASPHGVFESVNAGKPPGAEPLNMERPTSDHMAFGRR